MRRGLTTFILMFCMCWQALAHAGIAVVMADQEERQHALLHFEGQGHHHGDGADVSDVDQDHSLASAQHLVSDCGLHAVVLMNWVDVRPPLQRPELLSPTAEAPPPPPCLAGLERPPKTLA